MYRLWTFWKWYWDCFSQLFVNKFKTLFSFMNLILSCFCWAHTWSIHEFHCFKMYGSFALPVKCIRAQQKQGSMRFIKENTIFGYKKWWKTISTSFRKSSEAIHITFSTNLYRVHWQGGFTLDGSLFCTTFSGNHEKQREYRFWLQKRVKIQRKHYFSKIWRLII